MISRVGMAPRRPGLTTEAFVRHWRTTHADAAGRIPGLRRYVQLHPVVVGDRLPLPYPGFDACSILDFDDLAAMDEGFASPLYQREVATDEQTFIDKQRFSLLLCEPRRHQPIEPGSVVLATLLRRHAAVPADEFVGAALQAWPPDGDVPGHEQYVTVHAGREGRQVDAGEMLDLRAYPTVAEAVDDLCDEARGVERDLRVAGLAFGLVRLVARVHRVV